MTDQKISLRYNVHDLERVKKSLFFDFDWYLSQCRDLRGLEPALHYLVLGYKEGLNPSYFFNNNAYYEQNPDVRAIGLNPLAHFLAFGASENRFISKQMAADYVIISESAEFDAVFYFEKYLNNADSPILDALWHFLVYGADNGNNPSRYFDIAKFHYQNDIKTGCENIFAFYLRNRNNKKLFKDRAQFREYNAIQSSKLFDEKWYAKQYNISVDDALFHYITQGYKKKYDPSDKFKNDDYLAINNDVDTSEISPLGHYCRFGIKEGRYINQADKTYKIIKKSPLFDEEFYKRKIPDKIDPCEHYIKYGNYEGRNPSSQFNTRSYLALNPDVYMQGVNALYHYETVGRIQKRETSFALRTAVTFPHAAINAEGEGSYKGGGTGRVAIFSSFDSRGILSNRAKYFLVALQEVCDAIILIMDNPVLPEAIETIRTLSTHYLCRRFAMYDFGAYKLGLEYIYAHMNLEQIKEIIFCNDSLYGPLDGFLTLFEEMDSRVCDLWGLSLARTHWYESLQSFFYVARRRAFMSEAFQKFFADIQQETNRSFVVTRYELQMTEYMRDHGLICSAYVEGGCQLGSIPTKHPLLLIRDHAYPLIKRKVMFEECQDDKAVVLEYVRKHNQDVYAIMLEEGCDEHIWNERREWAKTASPYMLIKRSPYFDWKYCLRNDLNADLEGLDPVEQYLNYSYKYGYDPSRRFSSREYAIMYSDASKFGGNPLVFHEMHGFKDRYTMFTMHDSQYRGISPSSSTSLDKILTPFPPTAQKVVIFASSSKKGKIDEVVIYYLQHLKSCVDYILLVTDYPLINDTINVNNTVTDYILSQRHGMGVLGSYALGMSKLCQIRDMPELQEIILCSDSMVGPVDSFEHMFETMREKKLDFWCMTDENLMHRQLPTDFLVCESGVLGNNPFVHLMKTALQTPSPWNLKRIWENEVSKELLSGKYSYDALFHVQKSEHSLQSPLFSILEGLPLLDRNIFKKNKSQAEQGSICQFIKAKNSELYDIIERMLVSQKVQDSENKTLFLKSKTKNQKGKTITVHFYVQNISMFAARPLFEKLRQNTRFTAVCVVIPDIRFGVAYEEKTCMATYSELCQAYGRDAVLRSWEEEAGDYLDLSDLPDIVCYSSSYYSTHAFHSASYVARKKKTILINYGFFRSQYDRTIYRRDVYSLFWKVFLETDENLKEAKQYTVNHAKNCEVIGYAKMDGLAAAMQAVEAPRQLRPKIVLIAPHHSLPGGFNKVMHLSNFQKYHEFYVRLPQMYPQCHFIFRPHPMLFELLAKREFWGKTKVDAWIKALTAHANMELYEASDYFPAFARSDALIHDCGSYLVEYFYTQKPQCYLLSDHEEERTVFVHLGRECLRRVYKAYDAGQITGFINNVVLNGQDGLKQERTVFAQQVIMRNYPHVCDKIVERLLAEVG